MKNKNQKIYTKAYNFEKICLNYFNNFFKKNATSISNSDRITVSSDDFDISKFIISTDEETPRVNKPNGLYYAFGKAWIDFIEEESGNIYLLDIDFSKIFKLTVDNLAEFIKKYCNKVSQDEVFQKMILHRKEFPGGIVVNWDKFKRDYDGIEITDLMSLKEEFKNKFPKDYMNFLEFFDINGGVFWKKNVLNKITKIGVIENGEIKKLPNSIEYKLNDKAEIVVKKYNEETGEKTYKPARPEYAPEGDYYKVIHTLTNKEHKLSNIDREAIKKYIQPSLWSLRDSFMNDGFDGLYEKIKEILMSNMSEDYYSPELNIDNIITELFSGISTRLVFRFDVISSYAVKNNMSKEEIKELLQDIFLNLTNDQLEEMARPIVFNVWMKNR